MNSTPITSLPLCVDMDDTLIRSDVLRVGITQLMATRPWALPWFIGWLIIRRAAAKAWLAQTYPINPAMLPYRDELVAYLKIQKAAGRKLYLVSAADQHIVEGVADYLGLFDSAHGSNGTINLKGSAKALFIMQNISAVFVYAGDSFADLQIWRHAAGAILCGKAIMFKKTLPVPIEATFT
jgi:hypothetical protein